MHSKYNKNHYWQRGSTLVELILYVALSSIFLIAVVIFAWNITYGRVKSLTQQELAAQLQFLSRRISFELRDAAAISSVSSTQIQLSNSNIVRSPTIIQISGGRLYIGYGLSGTCSFSTPCPVSDDNVVVTGSFTNTSVLPLSEQVRVSLNLQTTGPQASWDVNMSSIFSEEVRSN